MVPSAKQHKVSVVYTDLWVFWILDQMPFAFVIQSKGLGEILHVELQLMCCSTISIFYFSNGVFAVPVRFTIWIKVLMPCEAFFNIQTLYVNFVFGYAKGLLTEADNKPHGLTIWEFFET